MGAVDPLGASLYFAATAQAQNRAAEEARKNEKSGGAKKTKSFARLLKKNEELLDLRDAGLPPEIAGKSVDDALVFLKDRITMAGDDLVARMTNDAFAKYREAVQQFAKFVVKNSFALEKRERLRSRADSGRKKPFAQIEVINAKLNDLASQILRNQMDRLELLKKTEEIQGLVVDIIS